MAVLPVLTWGDPRLKQNSQDIGEWTPELEQLVADMFETSLFFLRRGSPQVSTGKTLIPPLQHSSVNQGASCGNL